MGNSWNFETYFYDEHGVLTDTIDMVQGDVVKNKETGKWHNLKCKECGMVLMEFNNVKYERLGLDEIMEKKSVENHVGVLLLRLYI